VRGFDQNPTRNAVKTQFNLFGVLATGVTRRIARQETKDENRDEDRNDDVDRYFEGNHGGAPDNEGMAEQKIDGLNQIF
jgi:hypothetical protein